MTATKTVEDDRRERRRPQSGRMQAAVLHGIGDLRFEEVPIPRPCEGEALVRVERSGICGSDVARVLHKGTYSFPLIPGHEFAGTIVQCDSSPARVGQRVAIFPLIACGRCAMCAIGQYATCSNYDYYGSRRDGGFADYQAVRLGNLIPLPDAVSTEAGAMVEPAAVAVHALAAAPIRIGDTVAIFGAGSIGLMIAQLARSSGARVLLVDIDDRKLSLAQEHGWGECIDAREGDAADEIRERTGGGADVCIEAAGVESTFAAALRAARPFGRVVLMGNPSGAMSLDQDTYWQILRKQLTCVGVWNSTRNAVRDEWRTAIDAMAGGLLDPHPLVTHRFGLGDSDRAFRVAASPAELSLKIMFTPGDN